MKKKFVADLFLGIILVALLGFYSIRLAWSIHSIRQWSQAARSADRSSDLVFQSEAGISVWGDPVYPVSAKQAQRTIVFLLHGDKIGSDLAFWHRVKLLVPSDAGLRLVGYCDGIVCADAVRHEANRSDFPVIAYGEVISSQALINADAKGNSILRSEQWLHSKNIKWHTPMSTPSIVVQEALK